MALGAAPAFHTRDPEGHPVTPEGAATDERKLSVQGPGVLLPRKPDTLSRSCKSYLPCTEAESSTGLAPRPQDTALGIRYENVFA